ncbi:hypothetical protein ABID30_001233 [Enterococcus rotai]|uniref:YobI-like P-loop NTPase domain-containing protein n=1 Tax=Enterococcus rotai TaxID=118060 RepID=A0A0U2WYB3_9ENTE|nr:hypothetical protein [Enterococcus rotai]ALS38681.1 hypothetical protein ATZ35_16450 [Enterococcus rotai]
MENNQKLLKNDGLMKEVEESIEDIEPEFNPNFQKLTPEKSISDEALSGYKEALDYVFTDEDIDNIALTGVYGSGKSSILESYKQNSKLKFLHISLAHFDKNENTKTPEEISDAQEKILEGKILNQLLHQIDSKEIPQTIFRTKKKVKRQSIFLITSLFLLSVLSILYLLNATPWVSYLKIFFLDFYKLQSIFPVPSKNTMDKLAIMIILLSSFYLIYKLIVTQLNRRIFKGFSFKSSGIESDIEIFAETDASYFDKFLDDVLYLFVQSKADVIVLEDIDRFEVDGIFEKLKEINTLVNNKLESEKNWFKSKKRNKIRFLYLLKDDLFLSKDRTKFFDFIIPIVPVITSTNSYEKLKELLDASSIYKKFDRNFLQKISLYIDDMRLMKNIYNEFLIYSRRINIKKLNLNNNELLALLTYKNIFPKDFSDLLFNRGFVYNLFEEKKNYILTREVDIKEDIEILQKRLSNADNELASSIDELMSFYMPYTLRIGIDKRLEHFSNGGKFISAMRDTQETIQYMSDNYNWSSITFETIKNKIEEKPDFIKRKELLLDRHAKTSIQEELDNLSIELKSLKNCKIKDIISKDEIVKLAKDSYKTIEKNEYFELIVFLIRNGYINEGYSDYITYFYDNSLRINDKNFLRSISDEKALDWSFSLTKQEDVKAEVLDRMDVSDFSRTESLNFDLLEYMLLTKFNPHITNYLDIYFQMIKNHGKIQFIIESFLHYEIDTQNELILSILKYDNSLFADVFSINYFSDDQLSKFSMALLTFLDSSQFKTSNLATNALLREFISTSTNFLTEPIDANGYLIENITTLSPCFKVVSFSEINENIADVIFKNNLYEINFDNLSNALGHFFNITDDSQIRHKNYATIHNIDDNSILNYIESADEIDNYVNKYISFSKERIDDDLESIYRLLNNEYLSFTESDKYIRSLEVNDLELDKINYKENYPSIINNRKARANETNIMNYFSSQKNEWSDELIEFIKDENTDYSFDKVKANELIKSGKTKSFFGKTAQNNNIPNELYRDIIKKVSRHFVAFEYENISAEKIEILIECNSIALNETSLETFRNSYPEYLTKFILKNIDDYIDLVQAVDLTEEENKVYYEELYTVLYQSKDLSIEQQKALVECFETDEKISISNDYFSNELVAYILSNRFNTKDLEYICEVYDTQPNIIKTEVYKQVKINLNSIINQSINLSKKLLDTILNDENIELEDKQLLMSRNIKNIGLNNLVETLTNLSLPIFATLFDKKEPTFEINETSENILTYLNNQNVISSFREDNGKYKAYNRSRKKKRPNFID